MAPLIFRLLCLSVFLASVNMSRAINVDWLPADGDGPLPLSASYRKNLRRLCELVATPAGRDMPELRAKRTVLTKMCRKLKKDDDNIAGAQWEGHMSIFKTAFMVALGVAGAVVVYSSDAGQQLLYSVKKQWRKVTGQTEVYRRIPRGGAAGGQSSQQFAQEMAERFGASPVGVVQTGGGVEGLTEGLLVGEQLRDARIRRFAAAKAVEAVAQQ